MCTALYGIERLGQEHYVPYTSNAQLYLLGHWQAYCGGPDTVWRPDGKLDVLPHSEA
jgi:hypothetical protein